MSERVEWDPERNMREFQAMLPEYLSRHASWAFFDLLSTITGLRA